MIRQRAIEELDDERRVGYVGVGVAPVRLRCRSCDEHIAVGTLAVRDRVRLGNQFFHLACAVADHGHWAPALLRDQIVAAHVRAVLPALVETDPPWGAALQLRIDNHDRLHALEAPIVIGRLDEDERVRDLLVELEQRPDDKTALAVLEDILLERGDARGELIALQLALGRGGEADASVFGRRDRLFEALAPPGGGGVTWGVGFVRELRTDDAGYSIAKQLRHDSVRLLHQLELRLSIGTVDLVVPRSVRSLALRHVLAPTAELIARLPWLETLDVRGTAWSGPLAHANVRELWVSDCIAESVLGACSRASVPRLRKLAIVRSLGTDVPIDGDRIVDAVVGSGLLRVLDRLELAVPAVTAGALARLVVALDGRKLTRLAVVADQLPVTASQLASVTEELVLGGVATPAAGAWVEHVTKPDWGRGKVLRLFDGKLEIEFAIGRRVFKADAAVLRPVE